MSDAQERLRLFHAIDDALQHEDRPSLFLQKAAKNPVFEQEPFQMLDKLRQTKQSPQHHPEGSVWNHTMMVVDEAASTRDRSKAPQAFMWAALLHDIGKPAATKIRKGRITSYDHDILGAELARTFLGCVVEDENFIQHVSALVRWHMQILFVVKDMPYRDIDSMMRETDISEIALLGLCDRMGRLGADRKKEEENIRLFLQKCHNFARAQHGNVKPRNTRV